MTGRTASTPTTLAKVAAHGLPKRPFHLLHVRLAPTITSSALIKTFTTGEIVLTHTTLASTVALGPLTIRSLL